ncbi:MAG: hypothetical protein H6Q02_1887, partial [Acidobacteria bacterium]|nr:hypothetical protein [Acidobacteriota bacterium]
MDRGADAAPREQRLEQQRLPVDRAPEQPGRAPAPVELGVVEVLVEGGRQPPLVRDRRAREHAERSRVGQALTAREVEEAGRRGLGEQRCEEPGHRRHLRGGPRRHEWSAGQREIDGGHRQQHDREGIADAPDAQGGDGEQRERDLGRGDRRERAWEDRGEARRVGDRLPRAGRDHRREPGPAAEQADDQGQGDEAAGEVAPRLIVAGRDSLEPVRGGDDRAERDEDQPLLREAGGADDRHDAQQRRQQRDVAAEREQQPAGAEGEPTDRRAPQPHEDERHQQRAQVDRVDERHGAGGVERAGPVQAHAPLSRDGGVGRHEQLGEPLGRQRPLGDLGRGQRRGARAAGG